jgi:hypothetical protein
MFVNKNGKPVMPEIFWLGILASAPGKLDLYHSMILFIMLKFTCKSLLVIFFSISQWVVCLLEQGYITGFTGFQGSLPHPNALLVFF